MADETPEIIKTRKKLRAFQFGAIGSALGAFGELAQFLIAPSLLTLITSGIWGVALLAILIYCVCQAAKFERELPSSQKPGGNSLAASKRDRPKQGDPY